MVLCAQQLLGIINWLITINPKRTFAALLETLLAKVVVFFKIILTSEANFVYKMMWQKINRRLFS